MCNKLGLGLAKKKLTFSLWKKRTTENHHKSFHLAKVSSSKFSSVHFWDKSSLTHPETNIFLSNVSISKHLCREKAKHLIGVILNPVLAFLGNYDLRKLLLLPEIKYFSNW